MLYTQYDSNTGFVVEADTSYCGVDGCMRMVLESIQNEHDTFNMLIAGDFAEAADRANGVYNESSYITEGVLGNIFKKVAEFFKKILAKIKGIIKSIIDNIKMRFTKAGKELWNKYYKTVQSKMAKGELKDISFKYRKPKSNSINIVGALKANGGAFTKAEAALKEAKNIKANNDLKLKDPSTYSAEGISNKREELKKLDIDDDKRPLTDDEKTDVKEAAFASICGGGSKVSSSEFATELEDYLFDDEDVMDEFTDSVFQDIKYCMTSMDRDIRDLEHTEREFEKECKTIIKDAEDLDKEMNKLQADGEARFRTVNVQGAASRAISFGNIAQSVAATALSTYTTIMKKHQAQCKSIFIKAYNYKKKKSVDEAAMDDIIDDLCDYETDEMMNGTFTESVLF